MLCALPTELIIFHPVSPKKRIAIIPGDGIGPEVIAEAVKVVQASGAGVEMTHFDWSANRYLADGVTVPPDGFAGAPGAPARLVVMPTERHRTPGH